ncbi:hypothetical protein GYMLUDRAFT_258217 [Collybiopsis luxurians FD-317 M1]|nr:hypothetical protein GYMLUDRAFT_258217 [Collybiopsis luxurians FD-317 M1]
MVASSATDIQAPLTVGPVLVAVMINTFLYGLCFLQFITYLTSDTRDHFWLRMLIYWELLVNTVHSILAVYLLWQYAVENYRNPSFLATVPWMIAVTPVVTVLWVVMP